MVSLNSRQEHLQHLPLHVIETYHLHETLNHRCLYVIYSNRISDTIINYGTVPSTQIIHDKQA